jgi:FKBP-type peptidyl-prolyl cis-trans isomerase
MSDRPNKEQMMKIVVPALAISVVLVIGGLLIGMQGDKEGPLKDPVKPGGQSIRTNADPAGGDEGMTDTSPPAEGPEWRDIGAGLKIWDVKEGEGEPCKPGAFVKMHYAGWLLDGKLFDSSRAALKPGGGTPLDSPLGGLVEGWQKGVPGMKPGGIRRLYIPFNMAYGERGRGGIPPRADLIFEIKLISSH